MFERIKEHFQETKELIEMSEALDIKRKPFEWNISLMKRILLRQYEIRIEEDKEKRDKKLYGYHWKPIGLSADGKLQFPPPPTLPPNRIIGENRKMFKVDLDNISLKIAKEKIRRLQKQYINSEKYDEN